jgi:hypothetical protein
MNTPFKAANIILHVVLISIFIVVLFFTYGLQLEKKILEHQLKYIFSKITRLIRAFDPTFTFKNNKQLQKIEIKDDPKDVKKIDEHNRKLKILSAKVLGLMLIIAFITVVIIGKKYNIIDDNGSQLDMASYLKELGKMNLVSLIFVGLTYTAFITFVGYNYIYIDDNLIVRKVLDKIL